MTTILSAIVPALALLGLSLLGTVALQRATRVTAGSTVARPPIRLASQLESPESIGARMCYELARGLVAEVRHSENQRAVSVEAVTLLDASGARHRMYAVVPLGPSPLVLARDLAEAAEAIADVVREWRAGPEALERDVRVGGAQ